MVTSLSETDLAYPAFWGIDIPTILKWKTQSLLDYWDQLSQRD